MHTGSTGATAISFNGGGTNYGTIQVKSGSPSSWALGYQASPSSTIGTPVLQWTEGGNVGIGGTAGTGGLALLLDSTTAQDANGCYFVVQNNQVTKSFWGSDKQVGNGAVDDTGILATGQLRLYSSSSIAMTLDTSQGVTITSLAGTGSRAVLASAAGLLSAPVSDGRLKKNVVELSAMLDPIATVGRLRPVAFHWDTDNKRVADFGYGQELGFIAQEVAPVVPQVVRGNKDGYLSMDYDKLVPILVSAIQQLNDRVVKQDKIISQLCEKYEKNSS
jgi:hypothetical protein